ncbi:putative FBD-associated F-box protein At5g50270 [Miscanthus floridulus]|uniref:putative FBD-associated F-box protein At5g50270 n=1 Tax=Miscanthus floridulus TaxID=154761 RepID=UPI00345997DD
MGDDDHRRRYPSEDRISGLPDEVLQDILVRLGSARAAARTSVLSRRWRHVWADVPEFILDGGPDAPPPSSPASFLSIIDAALDAHAASTVQRLLIAVSDAYADAITNGRAASWLRFAAKRVAGTLSLLVPRGLGWPSSLLPVELPVCGRAKRITLQLRDAWRLQTPPDGVFTALTALTILFGRMEGRELTALVSTQCPCLRDLKLSLSLVHVSHVSVHSDTLRSLQLCISNSSQVEVIAQRLEKLCVYDTFMGRISAPQAFRVVLDRR